MTRVKKKYYQELLALTQLFLLREYKLNQTKILAPETYYFFQKKLNLSHLPVKKTPSAIPQFKQVEAPPRPADFFLPITKKQESKVTIQKEEPKIPPQEQKSKPLNQVNHQPKKERSSSLTSTENSSKKGVDHSKQIFLEPLPPAHSIVNKECWSVFPKIFPDLKLIEAIPDDSTAKKNKNLWMGDPLTLPVIILSFNNDEKYNNFLKNIAQAISLHLASAKVFSMTDLEKHTSWDNLLNSPSLRLVIASDHLFFFQPKLKSFYREESGKHFLNKIPLLFLSDISHYFKEPALKSTLWLTICNEYLKNF